MSATKGYMCVYVCEWALRCPHLSHLLPCRLSNTVSAAAASSPMAKHVEPSSDTSLPVKHEGEAESQNASKEQPNLASKPDEADDSASRPAPKSPVVSSMEGASKRAEQSSPAAGNPAHM